MYGRYIEPRTILWAAAEVMWEDDSGKSFRLPATLEDTSLSGACVRVQRPFTVGSRITVKWHREQFAAVARNCRSDGHGFLLGVHREQQGVPLASASETLKRRSIPNREYGHEGDQAQARADTPASPKTSVQARALVIANPGPPIAARTALRSRRLRPLALPTPTRTVAPSQVAGSSPVPERNAMPPKTLFPHFWRRQQDVGAPARTISTEVTVNKPNSNTNESSGTPSPLLAYEDIYRAAGIMSPGSGYGIHKVVEMLNNERIRDLSQDVKRASVLMALDAAGISADDLLTDATRRQNALASYETAQRKQLEDFESRKSRDNARIEEELEKVRSHYAERIQANLDQVAKEKDALRNWQMAMQHESQRIAEVIELCGKHAAPPHPPAALSAAAGAHGTNKP